MHGNQEKAAKTGTQNLRIKKSLSFREHRALSTQKWIQAITFTQKANANTPKLTTTIETDDTLEPMALFETAKKWFTQCGLE